MYTKLAALFLLLLLKSNVYGQEHSEEHFKHYRISGIISHTYLPTDTPSGPELLVLPSFGLDLEYWFNERVGVGSHNDIELETFEVERKKGEFIERSFPVVSTIDLLWKPNHHFVFLAGPGIEIESQKSYMLFRTGFEYEIELRNNFDFSPNAFYDFRFDAFNSFSIGLGVGFRF